jgi:hypothetical protein
VLLKRSGLAPDRVVLELTGRVPMEYEPLLSALDPLRQGGVRTREIGAQIVVEGIEPMLNLSTCPTWHDVRARILPGPPGLYPWTGKPRGKPASAAR